MSKTIRIFCAYWHIKRANNSGAHCIHMIFIFNLNFISFKKIVQIYPR